MRKLINILLVCVIAAELHAQDYGTFMRNLVAASRVGTITTEPDDPIHYWNPSVTSNSLDQIGTMHLTSRGSGVTIDSNGWGFGNYDLAYLNAAIPMSNNTSYTCIMWINPNTTLMNIHLYGGWILSDRENNVAYCDFSLSYDKNLTKSAGTVWGNSYSTNIYCADNAPQKWTHLAMVVNAVNNSLSLYTNGLLSASRVMSFTPQNMSRSNFTVGTASWAPARDLQYHGYIDKLGFYNSAKSTTFIKDKFNAEKTGKGF